MADTVLFQTDDDLSEPNLRRALTRSFTGDIVESGLSVEGNVDYTNNVFDLPTGLAFIRNGVETYGVIPDARTDIALTDSSTNYVYLDIDPTVQDDVSVVVNTTGSEPSGYSLLIATVDTSADTATDENRAPDATFDDLTLSGRSVDSDSDGVFENADVDGLVNLAASDAFSGYPLSLATDTEASSYPLSASDLAQLDASISYVQEDTNVNRPAAGTEGRIFVESDTGKILYDDGAAWQVMGTTDLTETDGDLAGIDLVDGATTIWDTSTGELVAAVDAPSAVVNGADVEVDHYDAADSGVIKAGDAVNLHTTELADGETLYVTRASHLYSDGTAAPTGVDLGIVTLDNTGGGTWQTTILSGDGATVFDDDTTGASYTYAPGDGTTTTVGIFADNGHFAGASGGTGNKEDIKNDAKGRVA